MMLFLKSTAIFMLFTGILFSQGFKVKASGEQTFSFKDPMGRNQATFFSSTMLEDIHGMSSGVNGRVTFEVGDLPGTLKGEISIPTASLKTGISLRDEHLRGADWLNADEYPNITFKIKKVESAHNLEDNKIEATVVGDFTVHGVTKEIASNVTMTYLDESERTKMRAPGDLLGVTAKFKFKLSDFGVKHMVLGKRVSDEIEVTVTMIGTNKF